MTRRRLMRPTRASLSAVVAATLLIGGCNPTPAPSATPAPSETRPPATAPAISPSASPQATAIPTAAPMSYAINGLPMALVKAPLPIAVMIDDNVVARPQSGFNAAAVVYQAPADGGEDRYMLVFQDQLAQDIGPVRSGRPYFVHWACEFRAGFAHYGGDLKTLTEVIPSVRGDLMFDMDALGRAADAFHRVKTREKPHNAYTSSDRLRKTATQLGVPEGMVGVESWLFRDDGPASLRPESMTISVPYNRGSTSYTYDRVSNTYLRSIAGKAQVDPVDGQRVAARNVIVLFMRLSVDPESEPGHHRPVLKHIGTGNAWVFRDGEVIKGTWRKDSTGSLTRFFDASGAEIRLVRGQVFVQVVPTGASVTYKLG